MNASTSGVDTIRNFPCNVLDVILGCLPWKDAVKTSILSKDWRDLSSNSLSGNIPPSLGKLNNLGIFNVSTNFLVGQIPSDGHLANFGNDSFLGNRNLCGKQVSQDCNTGGSSIHPSPDSAQNQNKNGRLLISASATVGALLLVALMCFWGCFLYKRLGKNDGRSLAMDICAGASIVMFHGDLPYSSKDIIKKLETLNEEHIIGSGGFGTVYKLAMDDGNVFAVKRIIKMNEGFDRFFESELEILGSIKHRYLVNLRGYCNSPTSKLLIYDFLPGGSLDEVLHERSEQLDWGARLTVIMGAAKGLAYLHHDCSPRVIHRDIKSSNILLDGNFEARVSDFGLAKLLGDEESHITTIVTGTFGYLAPAAMATEALLQPAVGSGSAAAIDASSPFYIHASDSPGMMLVNSFFDGKGYAGWSRAVVIALSAKNKLGFIDGSSTMPSVTSPEFKAWSRCNNMVISWILNSLSKDIAESVLYLKSAREIWKDLEERFGQCNGAQLYQLQKELSDTVQGATDIASYFTKVKKLWDELDAINIFDHCSCACTCGGKPKTAKSRQDGRLIKFLMGLNEAYSGIKSNILMMDPLPSMGQAYSLLIQDEKQREVHTQSHPSEGAFMVSSQKFFGKPKTNYPTQRFSPSEGSFKQSIDKTKGKFCTYCKLTNHVIGNCYRLIGYPADFKFTKGKKMTTSTSSNCARAQPQTTSNGSGQFQGLEGNGENNLFTPAQYTQLAHLFQEMRNGQQGDQLSDLHASANCAGPFNEEASGSW